MKKAICQQPPLPMLAPGEVHIWLASLEQLPGSMQQFLSTLSPDEQERAARFSFEKDRRRFIAARGILRALLGQYLHMPAETLRFIYNAHRKPALSSEMRHGLCFNLSHSHELALYAFAYEREMGVDIEYMRPLARDEQSLLAKRCFSQSEYAAFCALPVSLQRKAFFNGWTRKEAYIKARGKGLSIPLNSFDVSLVPGEPAALLASRESPHTVTDWTLCALPVPADYTAALMIQGREWRGCYWWWGETEAPLQANQKRGTEVSPAVAECSSVFPLF